MASSDSVSQTRAFTRRPDTTGEPAIVRKGLDLIDRPRVNGRECVSVSPDTEKIAIAP